MTDSEMLAMIRALLPDTYSESKDWRHGNVIERIIWLKAGLEDKTEEVDRLIDILNDGRIQAQAAEIERLRGDLAKAVKLLESWIELSEHCNIQEGVCWCGENMEGHGNEHFPLDHGVYIAGRLEVETRATLAELTGAKR